MVLIYKELEYDNPLKPEESESVMCCSTRVKNPAKHYVLQYNYDTKANKWHILCSINVFSVHSIESVNKLDHKHKSWGAI